MESAYVEMTPLDFIVYSGADRDPVGPEVEVIGPGDMAAILAAL